MIPKKDYTSTLMRIAGNVVGVIYAQQLNITNISTAERHERAASEAVAIARLIVAKAQEDTP